MHLMNQKSLLFLSLPFLITGLFAISSLAWGSENQNTCQIHFHHGLLYAGEGNISQLIKENNCSDQITYQAINLIAKNSGILPLADIESELTLLFPEYQLKLTPRHIYIKSFDEIIKDQLKKRNDLTIMNIKMVSAENAIIFDQPFKEQEIFLSCPQEKCFEVGLHQIELNWNRPNQEFAAQHSIGKNKRWFQIELGKEIEVYQIRDEVLLPNHPIAESHFNKTKIITSSPALYFQDKNPIKFFSLKSKKLKNEFVKNNDLTLRQLINNNQAIDVQLVSGGIEIKTIGISKGSGKLNDKIEIINQKSQKKYWATIINEKLVRVEL